MCVDVANSLSQVVHAPLAESLLREVTAQPQTRTPDESNGGSHDDAEQPFREAGLRIVAVAPAGFTRILEESASQLRLLSLSLASVLAPGGPPR